MCCNNGHLFFTPMDYNSCYAPQCPRREQCTLWHNAQREMAEGLAFINITNPQRIAQAGGYNHCPEFHLWQLRRFARGMRWRYGALTGDAQAEIHDRLETHFGRSLMGRMHRGDVVISPEEQAYIRSVFAEVAPGVEPVFLAFEEHYVKPPRRQ